MIKGSASGKLYWAGEYAVIEPGNTAIIMGVNRDLKVYLRPAEKKGKIKTELKERPIEWYYKGQDIIFMEKDTCGFIYHTLKLMTNYLRSIGKEPIYFDMEILSQLHDEDYNKFGFGSSSALIVAMVRGILKLHDVDLGDIEIFKLAVLASISMGSNSSKGDIAAATYGGLIAYTSFDRCQVEKMMKTYQTKDIIRAEWDYLKIERLKSKLKMNILIGWTRELADSSSLVESVSKIRGKEAYKAFLKGSKACVNDIISAIKNGDEKKFKRAIEYNRSLLRDLGIASNVEIETKKLNRLQAIAKDFGECAKLSGAGGGDCGLAFIFDKKNIEAIKRSWQEEGIVYFDL